MFPDIAKYPPPDGVSIIPDWEPPFHISANSLNFSPIPSPPTLHQATLAFLPFLEPSGRLPLQSLHISCLFGMLFPHTEFPRFFPQSHRTNSLTSFKYLLKHSCLSVTLQQLCFETVFITTWSQDSLSPSHCYFFHTTYYFPTSYLFYSVLSFLCISLQKNITSTKAGAFATFTCVLAP